MNGKKMNRILTWAQIITTVPSSSERFQLFSYFVTALQENLKRSPREDVLLIPGGNPSMVGADTLLNTQVAARVTLVGFFFKPDRRFTESPK